MNKDLLTDFDKLILRGLCLVMPPRNPEHAARQRQELIEWEVAVRRAQLTIVPKEPVE